MAANKYAGHCCGCSTKVEAFQGVLKKDGERWAVTCKTCQEKAKTNPTTAEDRYKLWESLVKEMEKRDAQ